jgi:hypothetical protein
MRIGNRPGFSVALAMLCMVIMIGGCSSHAAKSASATTTSVGTSKTTTSAPRATEPSPSVTSTTSTTPSSQSLSPGSSSSSSPSRPSKSGTTHASTTPTTVARLPNGTVRPPTTDEATVSAMVRGCQAFSANGCFFKEVSTPVGRAGTLYAIELEFQYGDGAGRGAVFFFLGTTLLPKASRLQPMTASPVGPGLEYVTDAPGGIAVPSTGQISVRFVVSSRANMCTSCVGNDGTETYVYGWKSGLVLVSGSPPAPPAVIGEGSA